MITRDTVREKLLAYLNQRLTLAELVDWSENALLNDEFEAHDSAILRDIIARLGVADVRQFGMTWEDCTEFLRRLGYTVEVKAVPA